MYKTVGIIIVLSFFIVTIRVCFGEKSDWATYKDVEGRFTLKYPNTWLLDAAFNITSSNGLKFYIDGSHKSQSNEVLQVGVGQRDESLSASSMNLSTSLRLDSVLFTEKFKNDLQNFSMLQEPDFIKYKIDGKKSFSFSFSFIKLNTPMKGLFVATDSNGSIFYILYTTDQEEYSKTLPAVEKIILSLKAPNV